MFDWRPGLGENYRRSRLGLPLVSLRDERFYIPGPPPAKATQARAEGEQECWYGPRRETGCALRDHPQWREPDAAMRERVEDGQEKALGVTKAAEFLGVNVHQAESLMMTGEIATMVMLAQMNRPRLGMVRRPPRVAPMSELRRVKEALDVRGK